MQDFRMETFLGSVPKPELYEGSGRTVHYTARGVTAYQALGRILRNTAFCQRGKKDGAYGGRPPSAERGPHYAPR